MDCVRTFVVSSRLSLGIIFIISLQSMLNLLISQPIFLFQIFPPFSSAWRFFKASGFTFPNSYACYNSWNIKIAASYIELTKLFNAFQGLISVSRLKQASIVQLSIYVPSSWLPKIKEFFVFINHSTQWFLLSRKFVGNSLSNHTVTEKSLGSITLRLLQNLSNLSKHDTCSFSSCRSTTGYHVEFYG